MSTKIMNGLDLQNQRIVSLADPSSATDAATKQYVDNLVSGLAPKDSVRAATTATGTLATAYANGQTIDGVTLATGDRVLLKNQSTASENGVYVVAASGAPTRATDFDASSEIRGAMMMVEEGTVNHDTLWICTTDAPITVGTTGLSFTQWTSGVTYTSGSGAITVSGGSISFVPKPGGFLAQDGSGAYLDTSAAAAKLVTKYSANIGDGSTTALTVTHNLGTKDRLGVPVVQNASTGEVVEPDITLGTNADTVTFATAPASNAYRYSTAA